MESSDRSTRDVAIPVAGLTALRRSLQQEAGPLPAVHALHAAGFSAGEAIWDALKRGPGRDATDLDQDGFFGRLSGAAGGPVAVLEVTCRTRGDDGCTFAFGSAATIHDLYGLLLEGQDLDSALASL